MSADKDATIAALRAEVERLKYKALMYDIDASGIEVRESQAVDLVQTKAERDHYKAEAAFVRTMNYMLPTGSELRDESNDFIQKFRAFLAEGGE